MDIWENLKKQNNLKCILIETSNQFTLFLLDKILIHPSDKLYYVNSFIENNYINLLKHNKFLEETKEYTNKIVVIKESSVITLKNPFIMAQQYDYIHLTQKSQKEFFLKDIILSFDLLKIQGIIHIIITNSSSSTFVINYFLICYSDSCQKIFDSEQEIFIVKV
jgi:hypothetical protein